jgi:hypothetical protein
VAAVRGNGAVHGDDAAETGADEVHGGEVVHGEAAPDGAEVRVFCRA